MRTYWGAHGASWEALVSDCELSTWNVISVLSPILTWQENPDMQRATWLGRVHDTIQKITGESSVQGTFAGHLPCSVVLTQKATGMIHQTRKVASAFVSLSLFPRKKQVLSFQNALKNQIRSLEDNIVCGKMGAHIEMPFVPTEEAQGSSYSVLDCAQWSWENLLDVSGCCPSRESWDHTGSVWAVS